MAEEYLEMEMASSDRVHECMQSITCEMKQLRPGRTATMFLSFFPIYYTDFELSAIHSTGGGREQRPDNPQRHQRQTVKGCSHCANEVGVFM